MKILYIHQYFCTRDGRSGTRSYEFARHLVRRGHQVTMLTSDSDLSDVRVPEGQRSARLEIEGIQIVAVKVPYSQHLGTWGRIGSFIRFMALSSWLACRLPRADVVLATSTPLTVGVPGLLASWLRRIPLVFEVRDLWPEAPIQMGIIQNPLLISLLRGFERLVYRRSRRIIALSPGMRDEILATGIPAGRVTVIPNCSDLDLFTPGEPDPTLASSFRHPPRFVIGYAGSMGEANDVDVLLDAARRLRDEKDICFLLVGQGKQAAGLQSRVRDLGLENVLFVGSMPRREVADMLRVFDVALVLFKNLPILATNSPNKLFDALAAGRPVLVNSNGWTRHLIEQNGVGRYAEPGSGESLAAQILWLRDHAAERREMGLRARALAEAQFDRRRLAAQFEHVLQVAAGISSPVESQNDSAPDSVVVGRAADRSKVSDSAETAELTR